MNKIQLVPFTIEHYKLLEKEIPDPKFLMQWAGPKYTFPLSWEQIKNKIDETDECGTKNFLFSASIPDTSLIIGHIQLTIIDRSAGIGNIGSVLVFEEFRKRGFGAEIIREIVNVGFHDKNLNELRLNVFDFNLPAIGCYKKIGFKEFSFENNAREVENESWNLIYLSKTINQTVSIQK
jgi:RimJ/RimL family protein N-acetyltransferase